MANQPDIFTLTRSLNKLNMAPVQGVNAQPTNTWSQHAATSHSSCATDSPKRHQLNITRGSAQHQQHLDKTAMEYAIAVQNANNARTQAFKARQGERSAHELMHQFGQLDLQTADGEGGRTSTQKPYNLEEQQLDNQPTKRRSHSEGDLKYQQAHGWSFESLSNAVNPMASGNDEDMDID